MMWATKYGEKKRREKWKRKTLSLLKIECENLEWIDAATKTDLISIRNESKTCKTQKFRMVTEHKFDNTIK